jgi:hypothetical protein
VSSPRHTFVVTVFEDGRVAVVEDVQTGEHARVENLARVGEQIAAWLAEAGLPRSVDGDALPGQRGAGVGGGAVGGGLPLARERGTGWAALTVIVGLAGGRSGRVKTG